jgi:hypothetical protein
MKVLNSYDFHTLGMGRKGVALKSSHSFWLSIGKKLPAADDAGSRGLAGVLRGMVQLLEKFDEFHGCG